jgi:FMN-dependent NADH-azoreductase
MIFAGFLLQAISTMTTILQLTTSLFGQDSQSSRLADRFVQTLSKADHGEASHRIIRRDLSTQPVPHLTAESFQAFGTEPGQRTPEQHRLVAESDALVAELKSADVIVIGLPMYNFGVPSALKAYFDHVARAGVTFRYTAQGPVGLLTGKRAFILATRGGRYAGTPADLQSAYVRQFLGFIGIQDVEFIYAEGLALGAEHRDAAVRSAETHIGRLAA